MMHYSQTFGELIAETTIPTNPKAEAFAECLKRHGEVMIRSASGETWGLHLGDYGMLHPWGIMFMDGGNNERMIMWDQVEQFWTHRAHNE